MDDNKCNKIMKLYYKRFENGNSKLRSVKIFAHSFKKMGCKLPCNENVDKPYDFSLFNPECNVRSVKLENIGDDSYWKPMEKDSVSDLKMSDLQEKTMIKVLKSFPKISQLNIDFSDIMHKKLIDEIKSHKNIENLKISRTGFSRVNHIYEFGNLSNLKHIKIDAMIPETLDKIDIGKFKGIESADFDLYYYKIYESGIYPSYFGNNDSIKELKIRYADSVDISKMPNLEHLEIGKLIGSVKSNGTKAKIYIKNESLFANSNYL